MSAILVLRTAQLNVLVLCGVLLGGFVFQFATGEMPCPLCMLQRQAMMLCALGPAFVIARARHGELSWRDVATGYGVTVLAAVTGATFSARQILLHIEPRIRATAPPCWDCTCIRGRCWSSSPSSSPPA